MVDASDGDLARAVLARAPGLAEAAEAISATKTRRATSFSR